MMQPNEKTGRLPNASLNADPSVSYRMIGGEGQMVTWRPIHTAPHDGTRLLVFRPATRIPRTAKGKGLRPVPDAVFLARWHSVEPEDDCSEIRHTLYMKHDGYWTTKGSNGAKPMEGGPTHWMPLPDFPPPLGG
jgi:hypothetical protein